MKFISHSEEETEQLGAALAAHIAPGDFVALFGGLGAGKTAFARGMAHALGEKHASSPTYTIVHEYDTSPPLFHFDCYRLADERELHDIGFDEYLARGAAVMEWPERVLGALPRERIDVHIEGNGEEARTVTIAGEGALQRAFCASDLLEEERKIR